MKNVPLMSLADIAESVQYGYTASASDSVVGPKFLRITDIVPPQIDWASVPYCDIDEKNLAKFSLEIGDIVIARTGATVGYAKLIRGNEPSVFASYLVRIRVDPEKADPGYVGRIVESEVYKRFVLSRVGGAAQPNANAKVLSSFRFPIPEKATQRRIAAILSAYDDLIENNRRRIQLLEESARLLYREWFVRFRFPGHEHVKIIDGVPKGWEKGCVGDLVNVQSGYAFKSKEWQIEGNPVIKIKNIENNSIELNNCQCVSQSVADKAQNFLLSGGNFLIAMTGATIGKVGIMPRTKKNYYLNQRVGIMRPIIQPKPIPFLFSFFNTENAKNQILNFASGSAQPNISPAQIESMKFLLPKESLLKTYMEICYPLFSQRLILMEQNDRLKQARDLLLPRLTNGEIEV